MTRKEKLLIVERIDLAERLQALDRFMFTPEFKEASSLDQYLMDKQIRAMQEYYSALNHRISNFK